MYVCYRIYVLLMPMMNCAAVRSISCYNPLLWNIQVGAISGLLRRRPHFESARCAVQCCSSCGKGASHCMYVCNCLHMYVYLWVPSSACFYRQGHVISFVRTYVRMYVFMYVCMYVCMYVYHLIFKTFFLFVYSAIQIRWKWLHGRRTNARWLFSQVPPLQPNLGEPFFSNYLLGNKW